MLNRLITALCMLLAGLCSSHARQALDSMAVYFPVGSAALDSTVAANRVALDSLAAWLSPSGSSRLKSVVVYGAASPDGPSALNLSLSRSRAESLAQWISAHTACPDSLLSVVALGADWAALRRILVSHPDIPESQQLVRALDSIGKHTQSPKYPPLNALASPAAYRYLADDILPSLRNARAVLAFSPAVCPPPAIPADTVAPLSSAPEEPTEQQPASQPAYPSQPALQDDAAPAASRSRIPVAITTNMLLDAALVPNIGLRVPVGQRFTASADWMYARWSCASSHRYWRIYGGDVEMLYRIGSVAPNAGRFAGHHIGVYASMMCYDFQFGTSHPGVLSDKFNYAAGLSYSYSMPVAPRLNIEFSIGVGYMWGRYKKHTPIDDHDVWLSTHRLKWFGPTKAGITLVWMLGGSPADKNRKGGRE